MTSIQITNKRVKQFCVGDVEVKEAVSEGGEKLFIKCISINKIDQLGISECIDFNKFIMGDTESFLFPRHLLRIEEELLSKTLLGFVTKPYQKNLEQYCKEKRINESEALSIFDQIVKAVYSLYVEGYATRNLRSQHFVFCQKTWRLSTLVRNNEYSHSAGAESEYLWSPKYQAPECFAKSIFKDEDFYPMLVWNMGCILLQMLLQSHKFSTRESMNKIKNSPFSFAALGLPPKIWSHYSEEIQNALAEMLHFNPQKRMPLKALFSNSFLSPEVAKHYLVNKPAENNKIVIGKSSVKVGKMSASLHSSMDIVEKELEEREKEKRKALERSKIADVVQEDVFVEQLGMLSVKIPSGNTKGFRQGNNNVLSGKEQQIKQPSSAKSIQELMQVDNSQIIKALQLYKSYFDQSELLIQSIDIVNKVQFPKMTPQESKQLRLLIKFAVTLVSMINLNALAEGFNQNRNVLQIEGDLYTAFSNSQHFQSFKRFVNFKRTERADHLNQIRAEIGNLKAKPLLFNNKPVSDMLNADYKVVNFKEIKQAYRFVVKHAYDSICDVYNQFKNTNKAGELAKTAMYVTYCLTTDKLYIKQDIPDNFKFYFQWSKKAQSNYVPLVQFKNYLNSASKEILIAHSKYVLRKYYNI